MANPARDARLKAQERWPGASVFARGRNWIKHKHPTEERYMLDVSVGPLHVENSETEIDTAWQPSSGAWQYEMTLADFQTHARNVFNVGSLLEFRKGGSWVVFDPQSINWIDENTSRQQIAIKQAVNGVVEDDILSFPAGYGPGRHFRYQNQTARLQKLITIDSFADLPAPTVAGQQIWFEAEFSIATSADVTIWLDGVQWAKTNGVRVQTSNRIEFRNLDGSQVLWWLDYPRAWDSGESETIGQMEVRRQGGPSSLFVTVRIPYEWMAGAVYPVYIDPTVDAQVGAGADDAEESAGGTMDVIDTKMKVSDRNSAEHGFYRASVTIPDGATIDTAYGQIYFYTTSSDDVNTIISADDTSNSAAATTTSGNLSGRTKTTASVTWTADDVASGGVGFYNTPELETIIQELVDSYDYSSGAYIGLLFASQSSAGEDGYVRTYESSTTEAPKLHIEYSGAGGTTYNQSAAGAITPSGAPTKRAAKSAAGALTPSGALSRAVAYARSLAGALAPSGALSRAVSYARELAGELTPSGAIARAAAFVRSLAGELTPAGALAKVKTVLVSLAGSLSLAGALIRQSNKPASGSVVPAGTMARRTAKTTAGALTPEGGLGLVRTFLKSLAGALTPAGTLARSALKSLAGSIAPGGVLSRLTAKAQAGALSPAGALTSTRLLLRAVAGSLAPAGAIARQAGKALSGSLPAAGGLARIARKVLDGVMAPSGAVGKAISKAMAGALSMAGAAPSLFVAGSQKGVIVLSQIAIYAISLIERLHAVSLTETVQTAALTEAMQATVTLSETLHAITLTEV